MKKMILLALVLMAPVSAFAAAGFDNSDSDVAVPSDGSNMICINAMNFDATNATGDVTFYFAGKDSTTFYTNEAAGATTISTVYNSSIATDAVLLLERADGRYAEVKTASANATTGIITVGAIDYDYKKGDKVYEAESWFTYSNVGTDAVTLTNSSGLICAPRGPVGAVITAGTFGYLSGFTKK